MQHILYLFSFVLATFGVKGYPFIDKPPIAMEVIKSSIDLSFTDKTGYKQERNVKWEKSTPFCDSYPLLSKPPFVMEVPKRSIRLSFTGQSSSSDEGFIEPRQYEIIYKEVGIEFWERDSSFVGGQYTDNIKNLNPATEYEVGIIVTDKTGYKQEINIKWQKTATFCDKETKLSSSKPVEEVVTTPDELDENFEEETKLSSWPVAEFVTTPDEYDENFEEETKLSSWPVAEFVTTPDEWDENFEEEKKLSSTPVAEVTRAVVTTRDELDKIFEGRRQERLRSENDFSQLIFGASACLTVILIGILLYT